MPEGPLGVPRPLTRPNYKVIFLDTVVTDTPGRLKSIEHMQVERVEQTPQGRLELHIRPNDDGSLPLVAVKSAISEIEDGFGETVSIADGRVTI